MANLWEQMGLSGKRAIIVHHDDLGMSEAANRAYVEIGLPTGSVMTPGAWATQLRNGDLGVHLTLTSEWTYPRMRPLTHGLTLQDDQGYFWPTVESAWQHIDAKEAAAEMKAQIEACFRIGIDPTHIDTHMGAVLRPDIAAAYHNLAISYGLPCLLPESVEGIPLPAEMRAPLEEVVATTPLPKVRLLDSYPVPPAERRQWYIDTLSQLEPGVYHLIHHAAVPTPESQVLPDWEKRVGDFEALRDPEVRRILSECVLLTYRDVRDAMRRYL